MKSRAPRIRLLLRWTFRRAGRFLTCEVTQAGSRFILALRPHFAGGEEQATTFESGVSALTRHAEIAQALRASGWSVASYTERSGGHAARAVAA